MTLARNTYLVFKPYRWHFRNWKLNSSAQDQSSSMIVVDEPLNERRMWLYFPWINSEKIALFSKNHHHRLFAINSELRNLKLLVSKKIYECWMTARSVFRLNYRVKDSALRKLFLGWAMQNLNSARTERLGFCRCVSCPILIRIITNAYLIEYFK